MIGQNGEQLQLGLLQKESERQEWQEQVSVQFWIKDNACFQKDHPVHNKFDLPKKIQSLSNHFSIIIPQTRLVFLWDFIVLLVILFFQMEATIVLAFGPMEWVDELGALWYQIVQGILVGILCADVMLNFNRCFFYMGYLQMSRKKIIINYLKLGFWLDLLGIISIVVPYVTQDFYLNYMKALLVLKFYHVWLIDENFYRGVQMHLNLRLIYNLVRLILIELVWSHYIGIIFYCIGKYVIQNQLYIEDAWLIGSSAYPLLYYSTWQNQYLFMMYFSVSVLTTIAYGNITPLNPYQTLYITIAMVPYVIIFAYVLQSLLILLFQIYERTSALAMRIRAVSSLIDERKVDSKIKLKIRVFLEQLWYKEKARDKIKEEQMINILPQQLKTELLREAYKPFRKRLNFVLDRLNSDASSNICNFMKERLILPGQVLYQKSNYIDQSRSIFFVKKGRIQMFVPVADIKIILCQISKNGIFGQHEFFTGGVRCLSAMALQETVLYELDQSAKQQLRKHSKQQIQMLIERLEQNLRLINLRCLGCGSYSHLVTLCPRLFYFGKPLKKKLSEDSDHLRTPFHRERSRMKLKFIRAGTQDLQASVQSQSRFVQVLSLLRSLRGEIKQIELKEEPEEEFEHYYNWKVYRRQYNLQEIMLRINPV